VARDTAADQEQGSCEVCRGEVDAPLEAQVPQADLRGRLERLPTGHPSSPRNDDRGCKPLPTDLAELELPLPDDSAAADPDPKVEQRATVEPLTDAEYAEHVREVRDRLEQARADGLASDQQYTIDPDREIWSEDREARHDEIIDELYDRAIIAGGLPGAGKSSVLEGHAGIDRSRFLTIDPDEIKAELARRGMIPPVENLSPMEASGLVHEESSHIARQLAYRAQAEGKNVVWDITMSSKSSTERRIDDLRGAGYLRIEGIFVDIPVETSEVRVEFRHRVGLDEYHAGKGDGGRYVPPEVIREKADLIWGSVNRRTFEEVKSRFDGWSIYDNSTDGRPPTLTDTAKGKKPDDQ
jgi:predicted ABC-type ATPase